MAAWALTAGMVEPSRRCPLYWRRHAHSGKLNSHAKPGNGGRRRARRGYFSGYGAGGGAGGFGGNFAAAGGAGGNGGEGGPTPRMTARAAAAVMAAWAGLAESAALVERPVMSERGAPAASRPVAGLPSPPERSISPSTPSAATRPWEVTAALARATPTPGGAAVSRGIADQATAAEAEAEALAAMPPKDKAVSAATEGAAAAGQAGAGGAGGNTGTGGQGGTADGGGVYVVGGQLTLAGVVQSGDTAVAGDGGNAGGRTDRMGANYGLGGQAGKNAGYGSVGGQGGDSEHGQASSGNSGPAGSVGKTGPNGNPGSNGKTGSAGQVIREKITEPSARNRSSSWSPHRPPPQSTRLSRLTFLSPWKAGRGRLTPPSTVASRSCWPAGPPVRRLVEQSSKMPRMAWPHSPISPSPRRGTLP